MTYGTICVFHSEGQIEKHNLIIDIRILPIYTIYYIFLLFSTKINQMILIPKCKASFNKLIRNVE